MRDAGSAGSGQPAAIEMERGELVSRLADGKLVIVNVLPREAFESGRIPGSRSLPLAALPTRASQVLPDRGAETVVYCGGPT